MTNVSNKFVEKIKTHFLCSITFFFPKIVPFMRQCRKFWSSQRGCRKYGLCALHALHARLHARKHTPAPVHPQSHLHTHTCTLTHTLTHKHTHTHTHTHDKSGYAKAPQCYVVSTLRALLLLCTTQRDVLLKLTCHCNVST